MDTSTLGAAIALIKKMQGQIANDYEVLKNKPSLGGVELDGDISLEDIGIPDDISDVPTEPLDQDDLDWIMSGEVTGDG